MSDQNLMHLLHLLQQILIGAFPDEKGHQGMLGGSRKSHIPPRESAKHLLTAAGCQKCLCVTFAKVTKADYFASPAHPHRRKENYNYG